MSWKYQTCLAFSKNEIKENLVTATGFKPTTTYFVNEHKAILLNWLFSLNTWSVFVYELSDCGFESRYSHLNFRYCTCFEQGVP